MLSKSYFLIFVIVCIKHVCPRTHFLIIDEGIFLLIPKQMNQMLKHEYVRTTSMFDLLTDHGVICFQNALKLLLLIQRNRLTLIDF